MSNIYLAKIRLHSSQANLARGFLVTWNLPIPDLAIYEDHTARSDKADGGQHLRGRGSFRLTWGVLTAKQNQDLRTIAEYDTVYATINKAWDGSGGASSWIDVSGKGIIPRSTPTANALGHLFENVTFEVRNLTINNDPASF